MDEEYHDGDPVFDFLTEIQLDDDATAMGLRPDEARLDQIILRMTMQSRIHLLQSLYQLQHHSQLLDRFSLHAHPVLCRSQYPRNEGRNAKATFHTPYTS